MTRWFHPIWQVLPRRSRQNLFDTFTSIGVASAPQVASAPASGPVVVAGALRAATGLGQAARLAVHALRTSEVPFATFDLTETLFQTASEPAPDGAPMAEGPGSLLLFVTPPNVPLALRSIGRRRLHGKYRIGAWVCETEHLPALWRRQARFLHALAAPSSFSRAAIAATTGRPVHPLVHPVEAEPWPAERKSSASVPTIGTILDLGSSAARKNVSGLLACCAQLIEQESDLKVLVKVRDPGADSSALAALEHAAAAAPGRLVFYSDDWTREAILSFLDRIDILVSFSRAEGFSLPIAEAMRRGTAVAAPIWGGPADYLDDGNVVALPYTLIGIDDPSQLYEASQGAWADVDIARSARLLGAALRHRAALAATVAAARQRSQDLFSATAFAAQLQAVLRQSDGRDG